MAQRKWFTLENTQMSNLDAGDIAILNRAARIVDDSSRGLTHTDLVTLRMSYKRSMSAQDLADIILGN